MSRLLKFLADELARGGNDRDMLHANTRLAIHLARRGEIEAASRKIVEIRALGRSGLNAESIARANLAEGVALFCGGSTEVAIDKLRRSRALGDAAQLPLVSRWARGWLAHMELNLGRASEVHPYATQLIAETPDDEHWTLSRVGSTIAVGLHFANRFDLARPWYEFARRHAVAEGDDLTIDANLHNVAAFRIHNIRLAEISGEVDLAELHRAEQEFKSSLNYDAMKASQLFRWSIPLIEAQLDLLACRFGIAGERFARWLEGYGAGAPKRLFALSVGDYALCLARQGELEKADSKLSEVIGNLPKDMAVDEMALLRFRQSQIAALAPHKELGARLQTEANELLFAHSEAQLQFAGALSMISCPPSA